jgi:hypothetical protein
VNTDAYTAAYWNAHADSANPARWYALAREARTLAHAADNTDDAADWTDTAYRASLHYRVARVYGVDPLTDEGRAMVADIL